MSTQPQLLHIALNPRDVVYTPDDVARDVVAFFKPSGKILEPCAGDGAFLKYLPPDTEWCEIEKGRDFFAEHRHFDWIVGNPPYSAMTAWMQHSFELAPDVVYILMVQALYYNLARQRMIADYGGIRTMMLLGTATGIGLSGCGFVMAAIHFQRGYRGGMFTVFR